MRFCKWNSWLPDHLVLIEGAGIHRWWTVAIRGMILCRLTHIDHCTNSSLKPISSLWERLLYFSWTFGSTKRLQVWHTCSSIYGAALGIQTVDVILMLSLALFQFTIIFYKEVIHSSEALIFVIALQDILSDCLVLVTSGSYACRLLGLHILYLHIFKSC